ncbi:MAG: hypothetical protein ACRDIW_02090 [Actinomycetota bacterium]
MANSQVPIGAEMDGEGHRGHRRRRGAGGMAGGGLGHQRGADQERVRVADAGPDGGASGADREQHRPERA